jgi:hypothetical protein
MPKSTYAINAALNVFLRDTAYTTPTAVYAALFNGIPGSGGTEVSGGSYARQAATFGAPSSGSVSNTNAIAFTGMPVATVNYIAVYDAASSGNLLYYSAAAASKTTNSGDTVDIAIGGITVTES